MNAIRCGFDPPPGLAQTRFPRCLPICLDTLPVPARCENHPNTLGVTMFNYKQIMLILALAAFSTLLLAQNPDWLWARNAGINTFGVTHSVSTAADFAGNVYVTGTFYGTAVFGATALNSTGNGDLFIAKLSPGGDWLWAKNSGGSARGYGIAVDAAANVYVTGCFGGTGTFGSTSLTSNGNNDVFAAKLDTNGNWLWVKSAGGVDPDYGWGIAVDAAANVYLTGHFWYTATFGATTLTSTSVSDIFIAKLDSSGNWLWARQCGGGVYGDYPLSIKVDNLSNVYLAGCFEGTTDFGSTSLTSAGYSDIFVAKLNSAGTWLWAKRAGGPNGDYAYGLALDASANAYLTGYYWYSTAFGTTNLTSSYSSDTFVAKLNSNGNWLWAKQAGGASNDWVDMGYGIALDGANNILLAGYFAGTAAFGNLSLAGEGYWWELFVAKLGLPVAVQDEFVPGASPTSTLYEAWPNPLPPGESTRIKIDIAAGENGSLQVFNLRGQCVASHQLQPGTHQVGLDTRDLPSGVYLYQLKTETVNETKRLILLK